LRVSVEYFSVSVNGKEASKNILSPLKIKNPVCISLIIIAEKQHHLSLDKKRIHLEFGSKPILTPGQLKLLRRILNMNLEEICRLLHIGKNSYGRWERGGSNLP
jgi:DNA-binding transcriptional regulator YiaG